MSTDPFAEIFHQSQELIPGGVHSPVRSFQGLGRAPIFVQKAQGAHFFDTHENRYIDFCMSFGPLILGHTHPEVCAKITQALPQGWTYGACETYSLDLARHIIENVPAAEQIRFVSSGTEAVMSALRLARGYTQRDKIIKFVGCYHGHVDSMLIQSGSGVASLSEASSAGIPQGVIQDTLVLNLQDTAQIESVFAKHHQEIAAVIIEPLPANYGLLTPDLAFLKKLRELCDTYSSLLIFDEVISGFRITKAGMAGMTQITPDLVTYGKVIGGGFPVGAVAGKKEIMQKLAPVGDVYQAGTLSANPVAMISGLATLNLLSDDAYQKLEKISQKIAHLFTNFLQRYYPEQFQLVRYHSLFWIHPATGAEIQTPAAIPHDLKERFKPLFLDLLERGVYLSPNAYEVGFVSLAHENILGELEEKLV